MLINLKGKLTYIKSNFQWGLLILISSGYMASMINIQGIQALMPFIRDDFGITRTQAGLYSTFLFLSAMTVAIFSGNFVDKIGSKAGLLIGMFSIGVLMFLHSISPFYYIILGFSFFAGFGFSIITPSVNKAIMAEVSPKKRAISMGIAHTGSGIGGFSGAILLPIVAVLIGWRFSIMLSGVIAIVLGIVVALKYNPPKANKEDYINKRGNTKKHALIIIQNRPLILVCMLGLIFGLAFGAIPAHYTLFLTIDLNYSSVFAGIGLGVAQLGNIFGRSLWGWVSDRVLNSNRKNSFILMITTIVVLNFLYGFLGYRLESNKIIILTLSFLLGVSCMGWSGIYFTAVSERVSSKQIGIASGVALVFLRSGVVIGPFLFGFFADYFDHYFYSWLTLGSLILFFGIVYFLMEN